jgi:hypothetical protein
MTRRKSLLLGLSRKRADAHQNEDPVSPASKARCYPRIGLPKGMQVGWEKAGKWSLAQVATLGGGGLFVTTTEPAGVGDVIQLYFQIPGDEVRASATVRSCETGRGMGVEFTTIDPALQERLQRLVARLLT